MDFICFDITPSAFPVSIAELTPAGQTHRRCVSPGDDLDGLPAAAQTAIAAHWQKLGGQKAWETIANPPPAPLTAQDVKAEAERRILKLLPEWKQRNLTARAVELLQARVINGRWTPEEAAEVAAIQQAWDRVKAIRARSDELERTLPGNLFEDSHWTS